MNSVKSSLQSYQTEREIHRFLLTPRFSVSTHLELDKWRKMG